MMLWWALASPFNNAPREEQKEEMSGIGTEKEDPTESDPTTKPIQNESDPDGSQ